MSSPVLLVVALVLAGGGFGDGTDAGRSPGDTVPESYALELVAPDLARENASFAGRVDIAIHANAAATAIALHSKGLVVNGVDVTDAATGRSVGVNSWTYAERQERVDVLLDGHVLAGRRYTVSVRFQGLLRDDGNGFFKSYYTSVSGERKWFAVTQLQTTHARSVFPCYDEPEFRTPFNISLKRNRNEIALSNMPVLNTVDVFEKDSPPNYRNRTWVHFAQTPPMSTYQVAFFVGEFECLDCNDRQSLVDVYSHLGSLYQTEYVDGAASDLLETMENYTAVKYGLPKLDLLAVPELGLGAVGNWGLTVYREKSIFVDSRTNTRTRVSAKKTTGRAMAHQWFGNLVTPVRWDFAWLDEGFATYFEYFATATLEPDWRLEHFFVVGVQQPALEYDQTPRRPLSTSARTPEGIDNVFDRITCGKGAAVLRMLRSWAGEETFRKALNIYLTRNRHKVVKPEHLWNAFENALFELKRPSFNNANVHTVMGPWTEQAGYPVVNVTKKDNSLVLTQKRFSVGPSDENDPKWFIRVSYATSKDQDFGTETTPSVWLDPNDGETTVAVADDVKWYIFNVQSTGFYRVNYTEDNWSALIEQLNDSPTVIHVLNRAQLIDDSFNLARAGKLNLTVPLKLTGYLEKEDDVVPWYSAMNGLDYVLDRMRRSENGYADVKAFVSRLAGIAFQKVHKLVARKKDLRYPIHAGWNAFSTWACKLDDGRCVKTALNYFRRWRNGEEIPADIKDAAFCTGVKYGAGRADWDALLALYGSTRTYSEKDSALRALACTANVRLLTTHLNLILEDRFPIDKQDYDAFFNALSSTPSGIDALTSFLQHNSRDVVRNVKGGEKMIMNIYSILATKVSTEDEVTKMSEMTRSTGIPVGTRDRFASTYRGEIEYNVKWFDDNSMTIREFVKPGSTVTVPETTAATATTRSPQSATSSSFSFVHGRAIFWRILTLSGSVKLLVDVATHNRVTI